MSDSISRKAALELKVSHGINEDGRLFISYGEVKRYLEDLPSAQPEIIRCKDCQFFDPTDVPSTAFPNMKRCGWLKIVMTEDGYCSYGRRKELKDDPSHPFADDVMMENDI